MRIELPFPPSTNTYYRNIKGRTLISKKGRQYKDSVYGSVLEQHGLFKPITGPVKITVELIPPDRRKRDLDNFAGKALYDALTAANVWMDDSQVKESHNYMLEPGDGRCTVIIEEL
jgi:crossover junction endodeoxyribonuclease RusA